MASGRFWKPGTVAPGVNIDREAFLSSTANDDDILSGTNGGDGSSTSASSSSASDGGLHITAADYQTILQYNPRRHLPLRQQRRLLPIFGHRRQLLYACERYRTIIMVGETGCGKTTQLPQYLHEAGWTQEGFQVCCTQPRRIAATAIAARVADEMQCELGTTVGYTVRFDNCTDAGQTRIVYMTDGILLREIMLDPLLSRYSVVMIDEAHERSLHTDVVLGLLKKIQRRRLDLIVIIASATLDARAFRDYFEQNPTRSRFRDRSKDTSCIVSISGRQFPVQIYYTQEAVRDYIECAMAAIQQIHYTQPLQPSRGGGGGGGGGGDILVFLNGRRDIETLLQRLAEMRDRDFDEHRSSSGSKGGRHRQNQTIDMSNLMVLPLYAGLPADAQLKIFQPTPQGYRKCILATNVAETSVTLDNITYVIDTGNVKERWYHPVSQTESLLPRPVSRAAAAQRAGRAGRVRPGVCYRLWTENDHNEVLRSRPVHEMQRSSLAWMVLQLKAMGIDDILHFDFLSPPPPVLLADAFEVLLGCDAIDQSAQLTALGAAIAEFPIEPRMGRVLIASSATPLKDVSMVDGGTASENGSHQDLLRRLTQCFSCGEEILSIVAMLQVQGVYVSPKGKRRDADNARLEFAVQEGDHLTLLNVYNAFMAQKQSQRRHWCRQYYLSFNAMQQVVSIRRQLQRHMAMFELTIVGAVQHAKKEIRQGRHMYVNGSDQPPALSGGGSTSAVVGAKRKARGSSQSHLPLTSSQRASQAIRRCLLTGYINNIAKLAPSGTTYRPLRGNTSIGGESTTSASTVVDMSIHPTSIYFQYTGAGRPPPRFIVYHEVVETQRLYLKHATVVDDESWFMKAAPHYFQRISHHDRLMRQVQREDALRTVSSSLSSSSSSSSSSVSVGRGGGGGASQLLDLGTVDVQPGVIHRELF